MAVITMRGVCPCGHTEELVRQRFRKFDVEIADCAASGSLSSSLRACPQRPQRQVLVLPAPRAWSLSRHTALASLIERGQRNSRRAVPLAQPFFGPIRGTQSTSDAIDPGPEPRPRACRLVKRRPGYGVGQPAPAMRCSRPPRVSGDAAHRPRAGRCGTPRERVGTQ